MRKTEVRQEARPRGKGETQRKLTERQGMSAGHPGLREEGPGGLDSWVVGKGPWAPISSLSLTSLPSPAVPARIVNISSPVTVNEGGNVNLLCLAVGRPEPTVTWRQLRGENLTPGPSPFLSTVWAPRLPVCLARFPELPFPPFLIPLPQEELHFPLPPQCHYFPG